MSSATKIWFLKRIKLFENLDTDDMRILDERTRMAQVPRLKVIFESGEPGSSVYLLKSGRVKLSRVQGGRKLVLAILGPGEVFGEIGYIRETERTADVRAMSQVSVLRFDYKRMQNDLKFFPNIVAKLNFNISVILGERLADMVENARKD